MLETLGAYKKPGWYSPLLASAAPVLVEHQINWQRVEHEDGWDGRFPPARARLHVPQLHALISVPSFREGGVVAVDWAHPSGEHDGLLTPTVIIVPGDPNTLTPSLRFPRALRSTALPLHADAGQRQALPGTAARTTSGASRPHSPRTSGTASASSTGGAACSPCLSFYARHCPCGWTWWAVVHLLWCERTRFHSHASYRS
jgi:hypothetical protein